MQKILFFYLLFVFTNLNGQIVFKQKDIFNTEEHKDTTLTFIKYKKDKQYEIKCKDELEYYDYKNKKLSAKKSFRKNHSTGKYDFNGEYKYFYSIDFNLNDMKHYENYVLIDSNVTTYYKFDEYINGNRIYKKKV